MGKIFFHYNIENFYVKKSRKVKEVLTEIFLVENVLYERIDYVFCDDLFLLDINQKFLKHDYFTDIITFNLQFSPVRGEIYISVERVLENAKLFCKSFDDELFRVMSHGIFHLCGINDKTKSEKKIMRNREEEIIRLYHS